jgi:hypothetical protein
MRIGIMSAIPEENSLLIKKLKVTHQIVSAQRTYTTGSLDGCEIVLAFSRWGKVAAAITAAYLINFLLLKKNFWIYKNSFRLPFVLKWKELQLHKFVMNIRFLAQ